MKLLITESQLQILVAHIGKKHGVVEEGWKDVVLGTAMLMGVGLTGANAQTATKALDDVNIVKKIEQTLNGPQIDKLVKTLESGGMSDAMSKLEANAEVIASNFENAAKKKGVDVDLNHFKTINKRMVKSKVNQGYAVSDIKVTKDTVWSSEDNIEIASYVEVNFDANIFKTGTFDLEDSVKTELNSTVESILGLGGTITSIKIVSSTDTEPIKMGNAKLAELRALGVEKYINGLGVDAPIKVSTLPEEGPDIYTTTMTPKDRELAREKTAKYRYVKVIITSVIEPNPQEETNAYEIIEKIEYELVRTNTGYSGTIKRGGGKSNGGNTTKRFKLKNVKNNGVKLDCIFPN